MLVNRILGVVTLLGWAMLCHGQDKLRVYHTHVPPYVIYEEQSHVKVSGILADIVTEMLRRSQITYQAKYYPPKRFYRLVVRGDADFTVTLGSQLKPKYYLISQQPILTMVINVYWFNYKQSISKLHDIRDSRLGVILGFKYDGVLKELDARQNLQLEPVRLHSAAIQMLQQGRIDYLLDYDTIVNFELRKSGPINLNSATIRRVQLYAALSRCLVHAQSIMSKLERSIAEMKKENYKDQVMTRYFTSTPKN